MRLWKHVNIHISHFQTLFEVLDFFDVTTLTADDDEGVTKVLSSSLGRVVHTFIHSS